MKLKRSNQALVFLVVVVFALVLSSSYFFIPQLFFREKMSSSTEQILINKVSLMPNVPGQFNIKDWKSLTEAYISFVFNFNSSGNYLPLIKIDRTSSKLISFDLPSYVGSEMYEGSGEAINCIAAVLSATMVNINMSSYRGYDWVSMTRKWFSEEDGIFLKEVRKLVYLEQLGYHLCI